ncbi:MAG: ATP-binding protein [Armatimonadota bacterium]|nr:ATP-binding protein [Armatimonadota bacterium]MDR7452390.1 ATP-binding protein [Armatimonadota bacterium]MDR7466735.1 ATP-binding protein [Armatimonadota bacterium]MDR7492791.1 ATP-binding protein [Armatimonadota bacterium]MDR7498567.1 ATP-binding protein [Armatimonadota bacterium]
MRRSIRWHITGSHLLLVFLVLVIFTAYMVRALERQYVNTYAYVVATQAKLISLMMREYAEDPGQDLPQLQTMVQQLRWRKDATIALLDATGRSPGGAVDPSAPEITAAFAGEEAQAVRADPQGIRRVYAAAPILDRDGKVVGVVHVSAPRAWVFRQLQKTAPALLGAMVLGLIAAVVGGAWLSRRITRPLLALGEAASRISAGDLSTRAPVHGADELAALGRTFNTMAGRLEQTVAAISDERNRIEAIVAAMTEAVIATDRRDAITVLNRSAEELLRVRREEVLGRSAAAVFGQRRLAAMLHEATACGRVTAEELPPGAMGDRVIEAHCAPVRGHDGEITGAVAVLRDVTEVRQTERLRRELTANVSHELRTPLTSIKGFVETLLDGAMRDEDTARRFLSIIQSETDRLVKLVDDLLDLSLLESKRVTLNPRPVDLGELIAHTVDKLRPLADHSRLTLIQSLPAGLVVVADADRLEQVFTNLVDNALKYTPPGGRVEIRARPVNGAVEIAVHDSGQGIRPEDLPHVFERFYRADRSRTRGSGGTGLGLAIAKHIVEAHGGQISVTSRPQEGTTFTVTIPISWGGAGVQQAQSAGDQPTVGGYPPR